MKKMRRNKTKARGKNDKKMQILKNEKKTKIRGKKEKKGKKINKMAKTWKKSMLTVSPAIRLPKSASWALWTKTCTQLVSYKWF